jgi:cobalamin synthase
MHIRRKEIAMVTTVCYKVIDVNPHDEDALASLEDVLNHHAGATRLFVGYCNRRIGGMTGDTLGALDELLEILTLALYYPLSRWQVSPGLLVSHRWFW